MTLSRTLGATVGLGTLALLAGGVALRSATAPSEPAAWSAAATPVAQVHLVSGSGGTPAAVAVTAPAAAALASPAATAGAATTVTAARVVTEESPEHERCEATLPAVVIGDPGTSAGAASGVRVWHDSSGWHLRATHPGTDPVAFSGVIRSGQPITATGYRLEKGDSLALGADRRTLTFVLVNHGGLDGVDLTDRCAIHTTFTVRRAGHQASPSSVFLGAHGGHPTSNPFQIERRRH